MKDFNIAPKGSISDIAPYVPGEAKTSSTDPIRLASNENTHGPSPKAVQAYIETAKDLHRYPDGGSVELREKLAEKYQLNANNIVCGTGSDELINLLTICYAREGDEVLYSEFGFLMYPIAAQITGATAVKAPEPIRQTDVTEILKSVTDKTKIVFLANPNNPTGYTLSKDKIVALRKELREDILLVLDGAYAEFVCADDYTDGAEMVEQFGNVVMLRTFSKMYGLSSLRVGWAYCPPDVATNLNRTRGVFNVNLAAQKAAVAALEDEQYTSQCKADNKEIRNWFASELETLGVKVYPSEANFLLVSLGSESKANACDTYLKQKNILIRKTASYNLPDCLRITIGVKEEMDKVLDAIKSFISEYKDD